MKKISFCFVLVIILSNIRCGQASSANKVIPEKKFAEIKFQNEKTDLGVIDGGDIANYDFKFFNAGNIALSITEVKGNCHCVQGKWPEKNIEAGDSSVISVSFDPQAVTGFFIRTLKVQSNATRPTIELTISGEIKPNPKKQAGRPDH
jgi:hypothetical protein